jgi:hypothetical protein
MAAPTTTPIRLGLTRTGLATGQPDRTFFHRDDPRYARARLDGLSGPRINSSINSSASFAA